MKIVFFSNYMNHHQESVSNELYRLTDGNYYFVACEEFDEKRLSLGYEDMNKRYDFIIRPYEDKEQEKLALNLALDADVMIFGSGNRKYLNARMKQKKLAFMYSERLYKKGFNLIKLLPRVYRAYLTSRRCRKNNLHMLCASAYTPLDMNRFFEFNKLYKWGYFPEVTTYSDVNALIEQKKKNSIVWVARFIDWKHPEIPVEIAKHLKADGYDFGLKMIGSGEELEKIKAMVERENLEDVVDIAGSMSPIEVRKNMEESEIFLTTSDKQEGWGAVLNESMNSACAVVASHAIGSAPFLINDGENGFIYQDGNFEDVCKKIKYLLDNPKKRKELSKNAYDTMISEWNPENAAKKVLELSEYLLNGNNGTPFKNGVCSKAEILKDDWM